MTLETPTNARTGPFTALIARWRRASGGTELVVVLGVVVGTMATLSVLGLVRRAEPTELAFSDARLLRTLGLEVVFVLVFWPLLRLRGWTLQRLSLGAAPGGRDLLYGIALWLAMLVLAFGESIVAAIVAPGGLESLARVHPVGPVSPILLALLLAVNPAFEEILYLGYCGNALLRRGVPLALSVGVLCRLLVHTYQGPLALFAMPLVGLVFGIYFFATGRLWPVIIAHVIQDFVGFSQLLTSLPD